jgi:hypothetical protein
MNLTPVLFFQVLLLTALLSSYGCLTHGKDRFPAAGTRRTAAFGECLGQSRLPKSGRNLKALGNELSSWKVQAKLGR